ncbi:MAG: autotransporter domain-containing protein, partial [Candidatus Pacearchaeota archaeon]
GTSVADGATLDLTGTFAVGAEAVTLAGGSTLSSSSGTNSMSGDIQVTGTSTVSVATSLTLSGAVIGSSGAGFQILDKTGAGTLTLSGGSDNTSLATTVDAGTLVLAKAVIGGGDPDINATARVIVNGGTLQLAGDQNRQILDTASVTLNGGTFDQNGKNETIGTLVLKGGAISGSGILTIRDAAIDAQSGSSSTILAGTQGLTKTTSGTVTLTGANTYTGKTAINGGTLVISADSGLGAAPGTIVADQLSSNGGTLQSTADMTLNSNRGFTLSGSGTTLSVNSGTILTYNGIVTGGSSLTKDGTGTLSLGGANTHTMNTNVSAGTLTITNAAALGPGASTTVSSGATLDINNVAVGSESISLLGSTLTGTGAGASLSGNISLGGNSTLGGTGTMALSGIISGSGQRISKTGSGTITLSGVNTYSGGTTISAGILATSSASALGTGAVTNDATLDIGSTQLSGIGVYTQNTSGSKLKLTIDSPTTSGKISSSSAAVVTTAATVDVTITNDVYIPNNTTFTILDTTGSGVSVPGTINSLSTSRISFIGSASNGDLILTANRSANGFSSLGGNSNAQAVGTALDNVTNPTSDMTTILNTLEGLSDSQVTSDLNTMSPPVNSGVLDNSTAALNNFVGASLDRAQSVLTFAAAGNSATGISSGDENKLNGIWAKEYGSYLDQGTRKGIQGYSAWNAGTAIGVDRLFSDTLTFGVSGGYAYGHVNSAANNGKTNINSAQGTIYAGYQDANIPYFIDAAGSFAWNWYKGKRDIIVGAIDRTADADYEGQQYGAYLGGGYKFKLGKNLEFTPLASLQWNHLRLSGYTETNAGSMNLSVNRQSYDILQSGLGASIASQVKYKWGNFTPEVHAKWLYDFIGDAMAVTSTYTGGGASFNANGAKPAKSSINLGGKLSFDLKNDISLIAECDTNMANEFVGVYGSATVRYKF